jgi:hypothetical protein
MISDLYSEKRKTMKKRTFDQAELIHEISRENSFRRTESYDEELASAEENSLARTVTNNTTTGNTTIFRSFFSAASVKTGTCRLVSENPPEHSTATIIHACLSTEQESELDISDLHVLKLGPLSGLHRNNNAGTCELFANFIVGSMAHRCEVDANGASLKTEFFSRRECLFASRVPRKTKFKSMQPEISDRTPCIFIWTDPISGTIIPITEYAAIREVLSELYTRILVNTPKFRILLRFLQLGCDLKISGDTISVPLESAAIESEIWRCFNWESMLVSALNASISSLEK